MGRRRMAPVPCLPATFSWVLGPLLALHYPAWTCARALLGQGSLLAPTCPYPHIHPASPRSSPPLRGPPCSPRLCLSPFVSFCSWEVQFSEPVRVLFTSGWKEHSGNPDVGPELGKSSKTGQRLGTRRGLRNCAVQRFSAEVFLFKVHSAPGSSHISWGTRRSYRERGCWWSARELIPCPAGLCRSRAQMWTVERTFLILSDVCLLEASSPAGRANLFLRQASVPQEMRAQCLHRTRGGPLDTFPLGHTQAQAARNWP